MSNTIQGDLMHMHGLIQACVWDDNSIEALFSSKSVTKHC